MQARLIHQNGQPFFEINGTSYPPVAFMSYAPNAERDASFRAEGMKMFSFTIFMGDRGINPGIGLKAFSANYWKGYGEYDFTTVDELMEMAAPGGKGAFIFPRLFCDAPRWWHEANPGECCVSSSGVLHLQCYASDVWRRDVKAAIDALMEHIAHSPWAECVFGYHLAYGGTEECTYQNPMYDFGELVDYSPCNLRHYRQWLTEEGYADADTVVFPKPYEVYGTRGGVIRDPRKEAHVSRYLRYHCHVLADTLNYLCQCVKEHGNGEWITGGFFGYIAHYSAVLRGHNAAGEVFRSPYVDFISTAGGGFTFASAFSSAQFHGKLWFAEGDIRTHLSNVNMMGDNLPHVLPPFNGRYEDKGLWAGPATAELSVAAMRRGSANVLTRQAGIWYFDMFGGWFDDPAIRREIMAMPGWMEARAQKGPVNLKPRVALIIDETGHLEYEPKSAEIQALADELPMELRRSGLAYNVYLAEDLTDPAFPMDDYDMYIFSGLVRPTPAIRAGLERLKGGGRTLVWMHLAGVEDPTISDFTVVPCPTDPPIRAQAAQLTKWNMGALYPAKPMRCGRFTEADIADSYVLSYLRETDADTGLIPAMLLKSMGEYTSVFSLTPTLPCGALHELAVLCGVFAYGEPGDYLFVGGQYVGLSSGGGGDKRLFLPMKVRRVTDALTGEDWPVNEGLNIPMHLEPGETRLFRIEE